MEQLINIVWVFLGESASNCDKFNDVGSMNPVIPTIPPNDSPNIKPKPTTKNIIGMAVLMQFLVIIS